MNDELNGKKIAITGCCGTVGSELVKQILHNYSVEELIGLDNSESDIFFLEQAYTKFKNSSFYIADIRDRDELTQKLKGIDIVFHTAAYKHVILCEKSPFEAVQTNILGVQNVIHAARENQVKKVLFTSSDKAVNPTNVMGTSKLMGERLITAANSNARDNNTIFASTRFGNVLGSSGSVIPIFKSQIKSGGPLTLTDPAMTRFIMSIKQAVRLVINSSLIACGGEVFITKMPVLNIKDLAEVMIDKLAPRHGYDPKEIEIKIIGVKSGEKLYEELMNDEETRRTYELAEFFSVLPAFKSVYHDIEYAYQDVKSKTIAKAYNSMNEQPMSHSEVLKYLEDNDLLDD
ncbi:MAG: polysaccharide biosynthesis protein [Desulfobulbaceae bacterium]|nr:MAG: polysaccharide biosynthesis protein [Desulfobulbaceae bacterium]